MIQLFFYGLKRNHRMKITSMFFYFFFYHFYMNHDPDWIKSAISFILKYKLLIIRDILFFTSFTELLFIFFIFFNSTIFSSILSISLSAVQPVYFLLRSSYIWLEGIVPGLSFLNEKFSFIAPCMASL